MLTITENARGHLSMILAQSNVPQYIAIRFIIEGTKGLVMIMDYERPDDTEFEYEGNCGFAGE